MGRLAQTLGVSKSDFWLPSEKFFNVKLKESRRKYMASLKSQQKEIVNILGQAQNIFERLVSQSSGKAKEEFVGLYGKWCQGKFK